MPEGIDHVSGELADELLAELADGIVPAQHRLVAGTPDLVATESASGDIQAEPAREASAQERQLVAGIPDLVAAAGLRSRRREAVVTSGRHSGLLVARYGPRGGLEVAMGSLPVNCNVPGCLFDDSGAAPVLGVLLQRTPQAKVAVRVYFDTRPPGEPFHDLTAVQFTPDGCSIELWTRGEYLPGFYQFRYCQVQKPVRGTWGPGGEDALPGGLGTIAENLGMLTRHLQGRG